MRQIVHARIVVPCERCRRDADVSCLVLYVPCENTKEVWQEFIRAKETGNPYTVTRIIQKHDSVLDVRILETPLCWDCYSRSGENKALRKVFEQELERRGFVPHEEHNERTSHATYFYVPHYPKHVICVLWKHARYEDITGTGRELIHVVSIGKMHPMATHYIEAENDAAFLADELLAKVRES